MLSDAACAGDARVNLDPRGPCGTYDRRGAVERLAYVARELDPGARAAALRAAAEVFWLCADPDSGARGRAAAWACGVELSHRNREVKSAFVNQVVLELAWASKRGASNVCFGSVARDVLKHGFVEPPPPR